METELSLSHGAEGDDGPGRHLVAAVVPVQADHAAGQVPRSFGGLAGCRRRTSRLATPPHRSQVAARFTGFRSEIFLRLMTLQQEKQTQSRPASM